MLTALAIAVLTIVPRDDTVRESCDLIELNHFYDENGRLVFDQVIFYDWSQSDARYNVRAWRLVKSPHQLPERRHDGWHVAAWHDGFDYSGADIWNHKDGWFVHWQDGDAMRQVCSPSFRETWLQYDPELVERELLPKEQRRELRKPYLPTELRRRLRGEK